METRTEQQTERWILKCRTCKHIVTREIMVTVRVATGYYLGGYRRDVTRSVNGIEFTAPRIVCPVCGDYNRDGDNAIMRSERINGHYNSDIPCNGKCVHAKGPDCECSCGGANHGIHYAG